MVRLLLVTTGPIDAALVRRRWSEGRSNVTEPYEMAICHVLPAGGGLRETLRAQRAITAALREALGAGAEAVAVLVASDQEGDRVDDYAREWGATVVLA